MTVSTSYFSDIINYFSRINFNANEASQLLLNQASEIEVILNDKHPSHFVDPEFAQEVIEGVINYLSDHKVDQELNDNLSKAFNQLKDCIRNHDSKYNSNAVLNMISSIIDDRIQTNEEPLTNKVLKDVVVMDYDNNLKLEHTLCYLEQKYGVHYLDPKRVIRVNPEIESVKGYPSQSKNRESYFRRLNRYKGHSEKLEPKVVSSFLSSPALNVPSPVEISYDGKSSMMGDQVKNDIFRVSHISINGQKEYQLHNGLKSEQPVEADYSLESPEKVYNCVLNLAFELDIKLTEHATKLFTQASMARGVIQLINRFSNELCGFHLTQAKKHFVEIWTKGPDDNNPSLLVRKPEITIIQSAIFGIMDLERPTPNGIKYLRYTRMITINRDDLRNGRAGNAKVKDIYSPPFDTLKQAEHAYDKEIKKDECVIV